MDRFSAMLVFARVVEAGSFVRAAERLGISTTAASRQMAELEAHLDTRLLNRTTRKLSLTEAGQAYYERCVQILHDVDEADAEVGAGTRRPSGLLRLTIPAVFGRLHLAPLLLAYRRAYPEVALDISVSDRAVDLVEEGMDLAIRIPSQPPPNLIARRLATARIVPCASPDYLARHGMPAHPAELAQHPCLLYTYGEASAEWRFEGSGGPHAVKVAGELRANSGDLIHAAVLAGEGISLEPTFIAGPALLDGRLQPLLPDYRAASFDVLALYPSRRHLSAKVRTLVDFLAANMGDTPPWDAWLEKYPAWK